MVSPQDEEVLWVFDLHRRRLHEQSQKGRIYATNLVRQQQTDSLQTLLSSINIVAQEEIVCLGRESSVFEQSQQVVVLSVDVSANLDGSFQFQQNGLCDEDFPCFGAEELDFVF